MKRAVSVSLGSVTRDKKVTITLFGGTTRTEKDRVEENATSGFLTLTYSLDHLGDLLQ